MATYFFCSNDKTGNVEIFPLKSLSGQQLMSVKQKAQYILLNSVLPWQSTKKWWNYSSLCLWFMIPWCLINISSLGSATFFRYCASSVHSPVCLLTSIVLTSVFYPERPVNKRHVRSVQISALFGWTVPCRVISLLPMALCRLLAQRTALVVCRRQCLGDSGSISITRSRGRGPLLSSTTLGTTIDQRSGRGNKITDINLSVWQGWSGYMFICLWINSQEHSENHTSPQGSDTLMQPVSLAGLVLAWILVYYCQVLIPVAPVHLIHPDTRRNQCQCQCHRCGACMYCVLCHSKHLKHQRRSGVPSQFFPTVTISPTRKDFRRQTGKERSMSKMVVAHCW